MFKRLEPIAEADRVALTFEGQAIVARRGDTVATALLAAGVETFRSTPKTNTARGPFCLMGACFECLVRIDGRANRQACLELVRDGQVVERQHGASADVAIDQEARG